MTFFRRNPGASVCTFTGGTLMRIRLLGYSTSSMMRFGVAVMAALAGAAALRAQTPGPNVNIVSKDPYLQKQNEPSGALSTRNSCRLVVGANDYRTVNINGLPADLETGDSWIGLYQSVDCGKTWIAGLMPGFPQDTTAEGTASPVKGLTTAADPTVRAGAAGFFAYSFIAFNRGSNVGKMALATLIDENNREVSSQTLGASDPLKVPISQLPIKYLKTIVVDSGSAGQFLDKPSIAVTPIPGATCTLNGQTVPASRVSMVWTVFVGNSTNPDNIRTKVYFAQSSNCGQTLDGPAIKLSEGYPINQGGSVAVAPNGKIFVVWREFDQDFTSSQILVATSTDGKLFTKATPVDKLLGFRFFDEASGPSTFRTTAFPTVTTDHNSTLHLAVSVRNATPGVDDARIVHLTSTDGLAWTMPVIVDPTTDRGHQIMPAITYGSGNVQLLWYDLHDDYSKVFEETVNESHALLQSPKKRHTLDVRGARGVISSTGVSFTTYGVLQFPGQKPHTSQYLLGGKPAPGEHLQQLQFNRPNLKLYAGGTLPFIGDYIDIAALMYVQDGSNFVLNGPTTAGLFSQDFHAFWTDNRDAKVDIQTGPINPDLTYTAPDGSATCNPTQTKNRNANIYTARISQDLLLSIPGNAKKGSASLQRAYAVLLENTTFDKTPKTVRLTIANQPGGGSPTATNFAAFTQLGNGPHPQYVDVEVAARSSAARTVFVTSALANPRIRVDALQGATLMASASINPDGTNPAIGGNGLDTTELHNPDIENPDIENPDIENPDIENPDIENPDIENPDIENPDIENPDIENPDIENPDIENPDIENPDIENGSLSDNSVDVVNTGNTTSAYQVNVGVGGDTSGYVFQLIGTRLYKVPGANGCQPAFKGQNQVLFNIVNPILQPGAIPDGNDPSVTNATVLLAPGEHIKVTLRAWDKDSVFLTGTNNHPAGGDGLIKPFCTAIGGLCTTLTNTMVVTVKAEAPNTGETTPRVATSGPDLLFQGPLTVTQTTAAPGDTINVSAVTLRNVGDTPAYHDGGFEYTYYLSTDNVITTADIRLSTIDNVGPIPAGGSVLIPATTLTIPTAIGFEGPALAAGNYYIGLLVDEQQDVVEQNELNNAIATATPIAVTRPTITTASPLPAGAEGFFYSQTLAVTGGHAPYTFAETPCVPPSCPPPLSFWGLVLNSTTGELSGILTTPGTFPFRVTVTDANGNTGFKDFSLTISHVAVSLSFAQQPTDTVPGGTISPAVIVHVQTDTGAAIVGAQVSLSIYNNPGGGTLSPANPTGLTNGAGNVTFSTLSINAAGAGYTLLAAVDIVGNPRLLLRSNPFNVGPVITTTTLAPAVFDSGPSVGRPYRQVLLATGLTGAATWVIDSGPCDCGQPPFGLTLSAAGVLSGTPAVNPGTGGGPSAAERTSYTFGVRVTDSTGATDTQTLTLQIHDFYENMTVLGPTASPTVNTPFLSTVELRDASNAVLPGVLVHLQITNNAGGATPFDLTALTNSVGVATFSVTIDQVGTGYTLVGWAPGATITVSNISAAFNIVP